MELSYFLAQLIGIALVLFSVAGYMRPRLITVAMRDFDHESFSTLFVGFTALIGGLAIVLSHNVWDSTWRVWITLIGWAAVLKGFSYLVAPKWLMSVGRSVLKNQSWIRLSLILTLALGIYLAYKGFGY